MRSPVSGGAARLKVILLMRKGSEGNFSIERYFSGLVKRLAKDIDPSIVELPYDSRGVARRIGNILFTSRLRADLIHVTGDVHYCVLGVRRAKSILTVHDFVTLHRLSGKRKKLFNFVWYRLPVWWAAEITTVSRATYDELIEHFPWAHSKCTIVPSSVGPSFFSAAVLKRTIPPQRILQVGTRPNKNLDRIVHSLEALPVHLRIIGSLTSSQAEMLELSAVDYSSVSDLSDEEMLREYQLSDMLMFVSTYEGFGLPIIEAQALGIPVVTSRISSMPEVAGDGALLVDPFDTTAIRRAVTSLINSPLLVATLEQRGRVNAANYTAEKVAKLYVDLYRRTSSSMGP